MKDMFTYRVGEENQPQVVDLNTSFLEDGFFTEQFKKSLSVIDSYCCHIMSKGGRNKDGHEYINNIFAFIGERGTGKTSCLLSVGKILCSGKAPNDTYNVLSKMRFDSLDLVDPTYLSGEVRSIVGVVVAQLYRNYCEKFEEYNCPVHGGLFEEERLLLTKFDQVQKDIRCLLDKKSFSDIDDLEQLSNLAATINLRDNIGDLIELYIRNVSKSDVLIIPIDDIDLQSEGATVMIEHIRKYLNHPRVIVLLALKLEQLQNLEQQKFLIEYKEMIRIQRMEVDTTEVMADHYLVKLIPHSQRILMPIPSDYLEKKLEIIYEDNTTETFDSCLEAVPILIFRKTRYLFYNINKEPSYIVPANLRQLLQLLKMLVNMQDYYEWIGSKYNPKGDAKNLYNKELFKNYFFESWTRSNLSNECRKAILELYHVPSALQFNSEVLRVLGNHFKEFFSQYSKTDGNIVQDIYFEIVNIVRSNNVVYNISLGDINGLMDLLERQSRDTQDLKFLFAIRTLYSMKLYGYYDEETDPTVKKNTDRGLRNLRRWDILNNYDLSNYDKLVGGSFINVFLNELMPNSLVGGKLSWRVIDLSALHELIRACVRMDAKDAENHKSMFRLAEFFMLTISRDYQIFVSATMTNAEQPYRIKKEPYYAQHFSQYQRYAVFDISSLMFNLTRIEKCYSRFHQGKEFFKKADSNEFEQISLLGAFKTDCKKKDPNRLAREKTHKNIWLSWASFRNAEILQDFLNYFEDSSLTGQNDIELIADFLRKLNAYSIKSYDKFGKEEAEQYPYLNYYDIQFKFSIHFFRIFNQISNEAKSWFNSIFYLAGKKQ